MQLSFILADDLLRTEATMWLVSQLQGKQAPEREMENETQRQERGVRYQVQKKLGQIANCGSN